MNRVLKKEEWQLYIANLPLKLKIFLIVIIDTAIIAIIALIGIQLNTKANNKLLYRSIAGSLSYSATEISNRLSNIETMSGLILANNSVQEDLLTIKNSSDSILRSKSYNELNSIVPDYYQNFKNNNIAYMNLYNTSFTNYSNKIHSAKTPDSVHQKVLEKAVQKKGAICWISDYGNDYGLFLGRNIRQIKHATLKPLGTLLVCVNIDKMVTEVTKFSNQYENASYIIMNEDNIIYHSKSLDTNALTNIFQSLPDPYTVIRLNKHNYFAVRGTIPNYNWSYICLVSYDSIIKSTRIYQLISMSTIIVCFLLSLVFSKKLIASLVYHFETLTTKMKIFGKNENLILNDTYDYSKRTDDIGLLHQQFNLMANKIQNLIQVNYVNELLKKEAQLKALENQINPHFLYNTLDSVNWRAKAIGEKEISSMVESLGNLLRITLSKEEKYYVLKQELELVQYYITIQKIRFEERLQYEINVDDSVLNTVIPKLTIQPLVENAIHYALEEISDVCHIQIIAEQVDQYLFIYVKNDGSSFDDNILELLEKNETGTHGLGIALLNINNRIKLTFGDSYGLSLYNENNLAVARLQIPYQDNMEDTLC